MPTPSGWQILADLWERSVIVTGLLTIMIVVSITMLLMTNRMVPDQLWLGFIASISFFFGTKAGMTKKDSS
jgi:hypothetical protein